MLTQLFRRRRPAARPAFVRRLALEYLEDRNAPSALDPTSSPDLLTSPDQSGTQATAVPAPTDSSSSGSGTTSATGSQPAPGTGTFLAVLTAPSVPPATTGSGTTTTSGGTTAGPADVTPPPPSGQSAPVIDSCVGVENEELTVTVSGHVTFSNPASLTVTFSGWVMEGMQTPVDAGGNFSVTFNVPQCTSTTTSSHLCSAVASDGAGHVSAPFSFIIEQTPTP
jgi:hypothetical protein